MARDTLIHPTAIVAEGAVIAADVRIGAYCVIGGDVRIGAGTVLHPHVVVDGHTEIGEGNEIFPFAGLGTAPQHMKYRGEATGLVIGDGNSIREHVTMHRGTPFGNGRTVIGNNNIFMTGSHVAHDCILGDHILVINNAQIAGHVEIGDYAYLAAGCGVKQFTRIGAHAMLATMSGGTTDIIPYGLALGTPIAALAGLNLVGLKSRGFSQEVIGNLRRAFRMLFESDEGVFGTRPEEVSAKLGGCGEVAEVLAFIRKTEAAGRPLCQPHKTRPRPGVRA